MKKSIVYFASVFLVSAAIYAHAQMPAIPGFGHKSTAGPNLETSQIGLVSSYVIGNKDVLTAQSKMSEALGLKVTAATLQATSDALGSNATKADMQGAATAQSEASTALANEIKAPTGTMDLNAKKTYTAGLVWLAAGMVQYTGMQQDVNNFRSGLSGASVLEAPKLQAGTYVITTFPRSLLNLTETMKNAVAFARSHGIEVPPEATAAI